MNKLIIFILLISFNLAAQDAVKIYKPKEIKFGEKFSLKLEVENIPGENLAISTAPLSDSDFGFLNIKNDKNGAEIYLIPFNVGISTFPALEIYLKDKNASVKSYPINLEIKPLYNPSEKDEIKDIARIFSFLLWLKILIAILVILSVYLLYKKLSKTKKENLEIENEKPDLRTPYQKAMDRISELASSDYLGRGMFKDYYSEISDILREYLTWEYDIKAVKMTTGDIIKKMKNVSDINSAIKTRDLLDICDMVKFAKYIPKEQKANDDLALLKEIVESLEKLSQDKKRKEEEERIKAMEEKK